MSDDLNDAAPIDAIANPLPQWDLSAVVIPLLRGVVYRDEDAALWDALQALRARAADYVAVLALDLVVDEAEGYAFVRSRVQEEDEAAAKLPRLVRRQPLSFHVSLLLALLRKKLAELDATGGEARLILARDEVVEMVRIFMPASTNDARLIDQIETHLNKVIELGFVRRLKATHAGQAPVYEVRRILKAFVDAQWLADFDERLQAYQQHLSTSQTEADDAQQ
ncbi:hypothetical protein KYG_17532 [Acidovorax sp. NO-1]|uniref:DUF4194 domain-containing protein n=1 Tax=Acidovorax sp. NO-1 TaxID=512030 RepID=UPI00023FD414|nr:DUF4194 domain-containing protein [Acidovorax sp. NO-1]EHL21524.1 hypothetical protein KYG_17532 [Acidovorax sp. NO-1]